MFNIELEIHQQISLTWSTQMLFTNLINLANCFDDILAIEIHQWIP